MEDLLVEDLQTRVDELEQDVQDLQHELDMADDEISVLQDELDSMEDAKEKSYNDGFNAALELIKDYAGEIER